jgi:hypothetical protein
MSRKSVENGADGNNEIVVDLGYITPESQVPTDDLYRELQGRDQKIRAALQQKSSSDTITVAELAQKIGVSAATARKLLDDDKIPGAYRKTPGLANSPWVIWADAPTAYLERHASERGT